MAAALADPGAPNLFDDRVYKRGALTLHALRGVIGDEHIRLRRNMRERFRDRMQVAHAVIDDGDTLAGHGG